jgi:hypothetical protein
VVVVVAAADAVARFAGGGARLGVDTGGLDWIKALLWVFRPVTGRSP